MLAAALSSGVILGEAMPPPARPVTRQERDRAKQRRRVQIHLDGRTFHVGYAPTEEAAQALRTLIKEKAPNARRKRSA